MFGVWEAGRDGQRWAVSVRTLNSMLSLPFPFSPFLMPRCECGMSEPALTISRMAE